VGESLLTSPIHRVLSSPMECNLLIKLSSTADRDPPARIIPVSRPALGWARRRRVETPINHRRQDDLLDANSARGGGVEHPATSTGIFESN
jgi:hypothetical protein